MKHQLGFLVLGLGVGTAAGWMMGANSSSGPPVVAAATKTDRPALVSSHPADEASGEKRATKRERPESPDSKPGEPTVRTFSLASGEKMSPEMKEIFSKMEERQKEARARKIDERLAALKSRLNLTPDQVAKVRALLEKSMPGMGLAGASFLNGLKLSPEGDASAGSFDEQVAALLAPEQREAFAAFQQEQQENKVEIATNREMAHLQQQLTLTPEQKDRAFQALGDIARNEAEGAWKELSPEALQAAKQTRMDALRPILTPEQMKAYESNPSLSFGGVSEVTLAPGGAAIHSMAIQPLEE